MNRGRKVISSNVILPNVVLLLAVFILAATAQTAPENRAAFTAKLVAAAVERASHTVQYDGSYQKISYPNGDVAANRGACSDEIVRIYRAVGIDLQKEVHEDMVANFAAYPQKAKWHTSRTDTNIDHRRVENLNIFFKRHGETLPKSLDAADYQPGDIVSWDLNGNNLTHIGMVVDQKGLFSRRYKVLHNIGAGPKIEDVLFDWKIIEHFRYFGPEKK